MSKTFNIKEVFNKISKKEDHNFVFDTMYSPKTTFQIETPNGFKNVVGMIIKEDEIVHLELGLGNDIVKVSSKHRIKLNSGNFEFVYNLKIGDLLFNTSGPKEIKNIKILAKETVYDIAVDDDNHEYLDNSGFVHHNTFGIKEVLTQTLGPYGEGPNNSWAFYEGLKTTGFGLYKLLLLNKNKLVVFDDSDSIWGDSDIINMMKIATSDSGDRTLSWQSNAVAPVSLMTKEERENYEQEYIDEMMMDPNTKMKAPSSFNFKGSVINISNMPANKFDDAIKSRAIFIDLYLAERDVLRRMYTIKKMNGVDDAKIRMLLRATTPDAVDALDGKGRFAGEVNYMTPEQARKHKTLNMRTLNIAEALYDSGAPDWERMAGLYA